MKKLSKRQLYRFCSLGLNLLIILFAMIGFVFCYFHWKWRLFTFYTEFSNFFALVTSTIVYIYQIRCIKEDTPLPKWVKLVKYFSTCCLTLTFLVVLFVLAPGSGKGGFHSMFISGSSLFFHLLNPLLAISSITFFEREPVLEQKVAEMAIFPTFIYATFIYPLIIIEKITPPYPFLNVYAQPLYISFIWFLVLLGAAYASNFGLYFISTKGVVKNKKLK